MVQEYNLKLGHSQQDGVYLFMAMGLVNVLGKLLVGKMADCYRKFIAQIIAVNILANAACVCVKFYI